MFDEVFNSPWLPAHALSVLLSVSLCCYLVRVIRFPDFVVYVSVSLCCYLVRVIHFPDFLVHVSVSLCCYLVRVIRFPDFLVYVSTHLTYPLSDNRYGSVCLFYVFNGG